MDHNYIKIQHKNHVKYMSRNDHEKIKFGFWNIEGLTKIIQQHNLPDILESSSIMLLVETLDTGKAKLPTEYYSFVQEASKCNRGRPSGGITVFIKPNHNPRLVEMNMNYVKIKIENPSELEIITMYYKPETSINEITSEISNLVDESTRVIAGDFNCRTDKSKGKILIEFMNIMGFNLLNDLEIPTYYCHNGVSTIDLIFVRNIEIKQFEISECSLKKHKPILFTAKIENECAEYEIDIAPKYRRIIIDRNKINDHLIDLAVSTHNMNAYEICYGLVEIIKSGLQLKVKRTTTNKHKTWFTHECLSLKKKTMDIFRNIERSRASNGTIDKAMLNDYANERRKYKKAIKHAHQTFNQRQESKIINMAENSNTVYNLLRKPKAMGSGVTADIWYEHFNELYNPKYEENITLLDNTEEAPSVMYDDFTEAEMKIVVNSLKNRKAGGPDGIKAEHLKAIATAGIPILTALTNAIWHGETFPRMLLESTNMVIYKGKGKRSNPASYRGIALVSIIRKIVTASVYNRLYKYVEDNNILPAEQYGFREKRCTLDAVKEVMNISMERKTVYCLMIDLRKAFDRIDRYKLAQKLKSIGIKSYMLQMCINILQPNYVRVYDTVQMTSPITQTHGVLQGDKLSPLLFSLFLANLPEVLGKYALKTIMYADDIAICADTAENAQECLATLERYCDENNLTVNVEKSKVIVIRKARKSPLDNQLIYKGKVIEEVKEFEYLGIVIQSCTWSFRKHTTQRIDKAKAALMALHNIHNMCKMKYDTCIYLYNSAITPVATYGSALSIPYLNEASWCEWKELDRLFIKTINGLPKATCNEFVEKLYGSWTYLCCKIDKTRSFHTHNKPTQWTDRSQQGLSIGRMNNLRLVSPTYYIDLRRLKGAERVAVSRFGHNGFHSKWCFKENCYAVIDCISEGTICLLCCGYITDIYHLTKCTYLERLAPNSHLATALRLNKIWKMLDVDQD